MEDRRQIRGHGKVYVVLFLGVIAFGALSVYGLLRDVMPCVWAGGFGLVVWLVLGYTTLRRVEPADAEVTPPRQEQDRVTTRQVVKDAALAGIKVGLWTTLFNGAMVQGQPHWDVLALLGRMAAAFLAAFTAWITFALLRHRSSGRFSNGLILAASAIPGFFFFTQALWGPVTAWSESMAEVYGMLILLAGLIGLMYRTPWRGTR